jgi:hypothetical protein
MRAQLCDGELVACQVQCSTNVKVCLRGGLLGCDAIG